MGLSKNLDLLSRPFPINIIDKKNVKLSNRFLSISFSKAGSFLHVHHLEHNEKVSFNAQVISYGTENRGERNSGAYLFLPDGDGKEIPMGPNDRIRIQRGPLVSRIDLLHEMYGLQYKLSHTNGELFLGSTKTKEYRDECGFFLGSDDYAIEVGANSHLTMNQDIEIALRFTTGIKNGADFFTDLNGFQVEWCKEA